MDQAKIRALSTHLKNCLFRSVLKYPFYFLLYDLYKFIQYKVNCTSLIKIEERTIFDENKFIHFMEESFVFFYIPFLFLYTFIYTYILYFIFYILNILFY